MSEILVHADNRKRELKLREKVYNGFNKFNEKIGYVKKTGEDDPLRAMVKIFLFYASSK